MDNKEVLTEKEYKRSLTKQYELLEKASSQALNTGRIEELPALTSAMIKVSNEINPKYSA